MKKILSIIKEILMWVVIIFAFSALGLGSDNPTRSALIWAIVGIIVFAVGFVIAKNTHRHTGTTKAQVIIKKIFGIILVLFGCILPNLILSKANFSFGIQALIFIFALVLVAIGILAVFLIKKGSFSSVLGYILLVIGALLPALAMASYDTSYNALGTVYYLLIALALFSWLGISMIATKKID